MKKGFNAASVICEKFRSVEMLLRPSGTVPYSSPAVLCNCIDLVLDIIVPLIYYIFISSVYAVSLKS
jgi:hypothetical protein